MADKIVKYAGLKLTLDGAAEFVANMKKASHETTLAYEEMKRLRYEQKASGDAVGTAAAVQKQMETVYRKQAEALKTVRLELAKYQEEGSNTAMIEKLSEKEAKLNTQLAKIRNQYRDVAIEAEKASNAQYQAGLRLQDQGERLEVYGNKMLKFGAALTIGVTQPLKNLGKASIDAAVELETTMANVKKVTNMGDDAISSLEQSFRDLSKEIPISTASLGELAEAGGRMFKQKDDLLAFTKMMADLNNTTNIVGEEGSESMMRFMSVVKTVPSEFQSLGSALVNLGNNFTTTEADILETSKGLASAGRAAGLSTPDILGFGTALSAMGIHAEKGGSAMSRLITTIEKQVANGGEKLTRFAEVSGMSAEQFAESWRSNPTDALLSFFEGLGKVEEQGGSLITVLDNLAIKDIRMSDVVRLLSINHEDLARAIESSRSAWQSGSALQGEAAERYATTAAQIEIQKNRLRDVAVEIGQKLIPILIPLGEKLVDIAEAFSDLDPNLQSAILNFGLMATALGPVVSVIGAATTSFGGLAKAFGTFLSNGALVKQIVPAATAAAESLSAVKVSADVAKGGIAAVSTVSGNTSGVLGGLAAALTGPVGLVAALAVATAGIGLYVAKTNEASKSAKEIEKSVEELQDSFREEKDSIDASYGSIGLMAERLKELAAVSEPTNDQISLMQVYVQKLNEEVPGLGLAFDATTGKLNKTASEIDDLLESTKQAAVAKVYVEQLSEAYQKLADADMKIADKQRSFDTIRKNLSELRSALSETAWSYDDFIYAMNNGVTELANVSDAQSEHLIGLYQEMKKEIDRLQEDGGIGPYSSWADDFDAVLQQEEKVIGEMKANTEDLRGEVSSREQAYRGYAESQIEQEQKLAAATQETGESTLQYLKTSTDAMVEVVRASSADFEDASNQYQSSLESAKSSTDQWATGLIEKSELTLETLQENARQNLETMTRWRDSLYELHGRIPEDVYEMFQRLGPAYSSIVSQLSGMKDEELAPALKDIVLLFADTRLQTAEELGKMPEDQAQALGAMIEWLQSNGVEIPESYRTLFAEASEAAKSGMKVAESAKEDVAQANEAYTLFGETLSGTVTAAGESATGAASTSFQVAQSVQTDLDQAKVQAEQWGAESAPLVFSTAGTNATTALQGTLNISGIVSEKLQEGKTAVQTASPNLATEAGTMGSEMSDSYTNALLMPRITEDALQGSLSRIQTESGTIVNENAILGKNSSESYQQNLLKMQDYTRTIMLETASTVMRQGAEIVSSLSRTAVNAASAWQAGYSRFYDAGASTMDGLISGINSRYWGVVSAAQSLADAANYAYRSRLDIHSPSRVMEKSGRYTVEGIIQGMDAMKGKLKDTARGIADLVAGELSFDTPTGSTVIPADYQVLHPTRGEGTRSTADRASSETNSNFSVTFEYYGTTESEREQFDRFAAFMESRLRRTQAGLAGV